VIAAPRTGGSAGGPLGDGEGGEFVETTYFCCCGQEWTSTRETVGSEYRRMNKHLKPLQWPEASRVTEQASWPDQAVEP
jgi:hypothetical protein